MPVDLRQQIHVNPYTCPVALPNKPGTGDGRQIIFIQRGHVKPVNAVFMIPYFFASLSYSAVSNKGTVKNSAIYHDESFTMAALRISALTKTNNKMIRLFTDEFFEYMALQFIRIGFRLNLCQTLVGPT
ncbi:MAG TPA: hypothetical protein DHV17_03625 [Chitinophagaceae bacterium]|nr:hypothetical protein [Chitinophagaceae bacterium]